jgi:hypothetical protein
MTSSPSPFDEAALVRPFIFDLKDGEANAIKKFSLKSLSSSVASSVFGGDHEVNESASLLVEDPIKHAGIEMETIEFVEEAIVRERHQDIVEINESMKQINNIQKGKCILCV